MPRIVERLGDQRALERDIFRAARAEGFVNRPTDGAMVNDAVIRRSHAHAVERGAGNISRPHANVADDDIRRAQHSEIIFAEADALARRRLPGDGEVGIRRMNDEPRFERDKTGDLEDNSARAGLLDGITQTAGTGVVQIGDMDDASAAPAGGETAIARGRGKRVNNSFCQG